MIDLLFFEGFLIDLEINVPLYTVRHSMESIIFRNCDSRNPEFAVAIYYGMQTLGLIEARLIITVLNVCQGLAVSNTSSIPGIGLFWSARAAGK